MVETDNKFVLHKFYNNLELKEKLFTDARNDSFMKFKILFIVILSDEAFAVRNFSETPQF